MGMSCRYSTPFMVWMISLRRPDSVSWSSLPPSTTCQRSPVAWWSTIWELLVVHRLAQASLRLYLAPSSALCACSHFEHELFGNLHRWSRFRLSLFQSIGFATPSKVLVDPAHVLRGSRSQPSFSRAYGRRHIRHRGTCGACGCWVAERSAW